MLGLAYGYSIVFGLVFTVLVRLVFVMFLTIGFLSLVLVYIVVWHYLIG